MQKTSTFYCLGLLEVASPLWGHFLFEPPSSPVRRDRAPIGTTAGRNFRRTSESPPARPSRNRGLRLARGRQEEDPMATMHPSELGATSTGPDADTGPTPGEREIFEFLKSAAKPDSAWLVWFEPRLGKERLEPDFLLFHKEVGFVIVEVKDWSIDQDVHGLEEF